MSGLSSRITEPWVAGSVLGALGVLFLGIHLGHAITEIADSLQAVIAGSVIPIGVSVLIAGSGVWVAQRSWTDVSPWRTVGWAITGIAVSTILIFLLLWYELIEGTEISHPIFVIAMFLTYGAAIGLLVARYDIHIQEARAELMRRTKRLDEFASIVSHDLRNPLNVASGYVGHARETGDLSVLSRVEEAHDRMNAILTDMLTLARSDNDKLQLEPVVLGTVARESWAMVETTDASLDVVMDAEIMADPSFLKTLFENLFRNAIEHNDDPITVRVGSLSSGFYIEDTGNGIEPSIRDRVFEAGFTTGGGSGLGLSIVRAAADAHDWTCTITESDTMGARFEFTGVTATARSRPGGDTVDFRSPG